MRVKNLFNYLHDFEVSGGESAMHDFRVEMKKLRAIIKFLRTVYPKQKFKKAANNLRIIFQSAGAIREYQILLQWLQKNDLHNIEHTYFPKSKMMDMIAAFHATSASYKDDLKEVIELCSQYIPTTNNILAEQYTQQLHATLEKQLHSDIAVTDWHETRKIIKQWIFALNWIEKEENPTADDSFPFYNKLQEAIGQWHDLEMIKENFMQKQIYLSQDIDMHKDFSKAWDKLTTSLKYNQKKVEEILQQAKTNNLTNTKSN